MMIKDAMSRDVRTVAPEATIREAARMMADPMSAPCPSWPGTAWRAW